MNRCLHIILPLIAMASSRAAEDIPAKVFGGADTFRIFNTAETVTVSRLAPPAKQGEDEFDPTKYRVTATVPVPPATVQRLRAIFRNPSIYQLDSAKACIPHFGVRFTFQTREGIVALDLCFECAIFAVTRDGKPAGGEDFDSAAPRLLAISRALFPKDKALQELRY
jgi:hypothetical protein